VSRPINVTLIAVSIINTCTAEPIEREEVLAVLNSLVAAINLRHKYVTDDYETLMTHTLHARDHPSDAVDSVTLLASQEITDEEMTPAEVRAQSSV
jgi:hypothetical protein